ncbi:MAG: type IA DNA topoisomerase [Lachnospiraceae bacterium]|nr:type IA DNA topoisomerase [Lachnospiraceae bacterium]
MKTLFIAEKPSVAQEFARALGVSGPRRDGYVESASHIVTWCVGHLVTMSYPEKYDMKYKKWSLDTLPFLPDEFKYEIIPAVAKQFKTVSGLLAREDVGTIYVCTDSGREGEYIYRLTEMMSDPCVAKKDRRRVWIDSFTDEEIARGIREAKPLEAYDALSDSAYLRAKEDYLMGINFSRVLTLKYGNAITNYLGGKWQAVSVGRVMTCVLGMVVRREREIREFVKTPFYRIIGVFGGIEAEWKADPQSPLLPKLYKDNGFRKREDAEEFIRELKKTDPYEGHVLSVSRKKEKKNPPMLYNLAELQNDCSKMFKISPDQTLQIAQELYEKKLTTYPRTDARVLSSAVAKEIGRNLNGLAKLGTAGPGEAPRVADFAQEVLAGSAWQSIGKTRYTNDKAITDHYAIIPTGSGLQNLRSLSPTAAKVYDTIARRFLAIFYPPAEYDKTAVTIALGKENFYANSKVLVKEGWLRVNGGEKKEGGETEARLKKLKKGEILPVDSLSIREGETSPPKRYTSGSMILAMENAGQLIEDESLREMIKSSGIGTSATRAEILKKLINIRYLKLNKKTQVITPELLGEMVYDTVNASIRPLLNPELTASWEKGLTGVAEGNITTDEYMEKLTGFVARRTEGVKGLNNQVALRAAYDAAAKFYAKPAAGSSGKRRKSQASAE